MTNEAREIFLRKFSESYDLPAAVKAAGIKSAEAHAYLRAEGAQEVDRRVQRRLAGEMLTRIRGEYEQIAFNMEEKVSDRIRALEQLRLLSASDFGEDSEETFTVRVEYV